MGETERRKACCVHVRSASRCRENLNQTRDSQDTFTSVLVSLKLHSLCSSSGLCSVVMGHRKQSAPSPATTDAQNPLSSFLLGKSAQKTAVDSALDDIFKSSVSSAPVSPPIYILFLLVGRLSFRLAQVQPLCLRPQHGPRNPPRILLPRNPPNENTRPRPPPNCPTPTPKSLACRRAPLPLLPLRFPIQC